MGTRGERKLVCNACMILTSEYWDDYFLHPLISSCSTFVFHYVFIWKFKGPVLYLMHSFSFGHLMAPEMPK